MPTPAIQSVLFFKQNDDGQNKEVILVASISGLLGTGADKQPVIIPQSNFATASDLANHLADLANPHQVTRTQVGLSNVLNVAQIPATDKGANSGVATLDVNGKLTAGQIPSSLVGGMVYQSAWNATANSPAIPTASADNNGWYYKVSVAGGTEIDGISDWGVGDWIVSNGAAWEKIDNTEAVSSVCGKSGAVTLNVGDIAGSSRVPGWVYTTGAIGNGLFTSNNSGIPATTSLSFYDDVVPLGQAAVGSRIVLTDSTGIASAFEVQASSTTGGISTLTVVFRAGVGNPWVATGTERYTVVFIPVAGTTFESLNVSTGGTQFAGVGSDGAGSLVSLAIGAFGGTPLTILNADGSAQVVSLALFTGATQLAGIASDGSGSLASLVIASTVGGSAVIHLNSDGTADFNQVQAITVKGNTGVFGSAESSAKVTITESGIGFVDDTTTIFTVGADGSIFSMGGGTVSLCGTTFTISASGAVVCQTLQSNGVLDDSGVQILAARQPGIFDLGLPPALSGDYSADTSALAAWFTSLTTQFNIALAMLRTHGLISS